MRITALRNWYRARRMWARVLRLDVIETTLFGFRRPSAWNHGLIDPTLLL